ncbi:winged helix-turn-helix domain-containing protein [Saccharopolyspora rosea]|uniref:Winged helix-turn-helix domain-containing protein n=1 Tax=Saccharopolyspora rosea TaxID=524884 RepID=A0ABW3FTQ7_9PSEU|nr:winged helix-turn-helix domain-containing protein [Saccharopolyspora rosea]
MEPDPLPKTERTTTIELVARVVVQGDDVDALATSLARTLQSLSGGAPNIEVRRGQPARPHVPHLRSLPRPQEPAPRVVLHAPSRRVLLDGNPVSLTKVEYEFLLFLCDHPDTVHSRAELLRAVWGFEHALDTTRTVDVHVRRLRRKLGAEVITTVRGVGYRLDDTGLVAVRRD